MAIAIDQVVAGNGGGSQDSMTSASFTPPSGSVIVVRASSYAGSGDDGSTITISDSIGLTWTKHVERSQGDDGAGITPPPIVMWTAVGTGAAMTVTTTRSNGVGFNHVQVIWVLTGAHTSSPVVDTAEQSTAGAMSLSLDTTVSGCMLLGGLVDWLEATDVPVEDANSTTDYAIATGTIQGSWGGHRAVGAAGTYTIGTSFPNSSTDTNAVAVAVQPAAAGAVSGTGSANLGGLTATATGLRTVNGVAAAPLAGLTATASGRRTVNAAAVCTLAGLTATATGSRTVHGAAGGGLGALTATAVVYGAGVATGFRHESTRTNFRRIGGA